MNPLDKHNTTKDDTSDHLIAFLVILGAIGFILQQSFSSNTSDILGKHPLSNQVEKSVPPATSYTHTEQHHLTTDAERQQAEKEFADAAVQNWTDDLEQQGRQDTPLPRKKAALVASAAATATPLVSKPKEFSKTPTQQLSSTIVVEEKIKAPIATPKKDKEVFIDTNLPATKIADKPISTKKTTTTEIKEKLATDKPNTTNTKVSELKEKLASKKEQVVTNYEATSPAITPNKEQFQEKGSTAKAPSQPKKEVKKSIKKKAAKESCVIIVATLQDAENIKRLVQTLQSDNYQIYNRRSGKNRSIGIKTSCNPSVYQPLLQTIQKKYAPDAWLKRR